AAPPGSHGGRTLTSVRLAEALGLAAEGAPSDEQLIRLRDERSGWEQVRTAGELRREGLRVSLGAYEARVLTVALVEPEPPKPVPAPATEPARRASRPPLVQRQIPGSRRRAAQPARRKTTRVSPPRRRP